MRVLWLIGTGMLEDEGVRVLADIGVLSAEELLPVLNRLPLARGVELLRGAEDPKPTGVRRPAVEPRGAPPPPDRMLLDRLTDEPPLGESSELSETCDPAREPLREPPWAAEARLKAKVSSA